jgi:hypothetical protein
MGLQERVISHLTNDNVYGNFCYKVARTVSPAPPFFRLCVYPRTSALTATRRLQPYTRRLCFQNVKDSDDRNSCDHLSVHLIQGTHFHAVADSFALLRTLKNVNRFTIKQIQSLFTKHRGWGYPVRVSATPVEIPMSRTPRWGGRVVLQTFRRANVHTLSFAL